MSCNFEIRTISDVVTCKLVNQILLNNHRCNKPRVYSFQNDRTVNISPSSIHYCRLISPNLVVVNFLLSSLQTKPFTRKCRPVELSTNHLMKVHVTAACTISVRIHKNILCWQINKLKLNCGLEQIQLIQLINTY